MPGCLAQPLFHFASYQGNHGNSPTWHSCCLSHSNSLSGVSTCLTVQSEKRSTVHIKHRPGQLEENDPAGRDLLEMVALEGNLCPVSAHIPPPPHFLAYTYIVSTPSTVSSKITHSRQGPAPHGSSYGIAKNYAVLWEFKFKEIQYVHHLSVKVTC